MVIREHNTPPVLLNKRKTHSSVILCERSQILENKLPHNSTPGTNLTNLRFLIQITTEYDKISFMNRLITVQSKRDVPSKYRNTPIELLFEYHNFGRPKDVYSLPQLLIGMCMDNRKHLRLPDNFAFILRTGGANLIHNDFAVSYAISVGAIKHIVLIGHDQCGMVDLISRKEQFIQGLTENAGWDRQTAEEHFDHSAPIFEIGNEIDFVLRESKRLSLKYQKIVVVPLVYRIENNLLHMIKSD